MKHKPLPPEEEEKYNKVSYRIVNGEKKLVTSNCVRDTRKWIERQYNNVLWEAYLATKGNFKWRYTKPIEDIYLYIAITSNYWRNKPPDELE